MLAADAVAVEIDYGHGRIEQRRCSVIADLSLVEKAAEWASLQVLVRVESERHHKATGKSRAKSATTLLASRRTAERLNGSIRQHWASKTNCTGCSIWASTKTRTANALDTRRRTFSVLNRIALNLLKQDKTSKRGVHGKRLKAGWDNGYLSTYWENKMRLPCSAG